MSHTIPVYSQTPRTGTTPQTVEQSHVARR